MRDQQNKEIVPMELTNKINRWNFDKSVIKMRELGQQWSKMTAQVARELFLAKEFLINQKKQRKDSSDSNQYTWEAYCGAIGMDRQIADFWIKKFIPREISGTGKDVLLLKAPVKTDSSASRALMQGRINEFFITGERPAGWTEDDEKELQRQTENARLAEKVEKYNAPTYFKANDHFADALRRSKDITNFKLENSVQIQAQYKVIRYIEEYLNAFENLETQARAAFNIALKARNLANEIAEKNFQIQNAQLKEESGDDS